MMRSSRSSGGAAGGGGVASTVQVVFIVLKLIGTIDWPWIWVLAPTWISIICVTIIILIMWTISRF